MNLQAKSGLNSYLEAFKIDYDDLDYAIIEGDIKLLESIKEFCSIPPLVPPLEKSTGINQRNSIRFNDIDDPKQYRWSSMKDVVNPNQKLLNITSTIPNVTSRKLDNKSNISPFKNHLEQRFTVVPVYSKLLPKRKDKIDYAKSPRDKFEQQGNFEKGMFGLVLCQLSTTFQSKINFICT